MAALFKVPNFQYGVRTFTISQKSPNLASTFTVTFLSEVRCTFHANNVSSQKSL